MVDTLALGASAFGYEGSSPSLRTTQLLRFFTKLSDRGEMVDTLP
jgi:hypothetical protein